ncbi:hypothetical protein JHW45_17645 [Paracoccus stylophorae]|uniref:Uncharacterized protein n=1 Tax=Paracoccus stylophorae TaxID=659350 RepID=A0ABY7SUW3_9RHOB|nr:hypothetical protein [Paracoccus stylophorae]WCR10829.1 hypothetical protein JHW45_17645 [Paracoccus stylophorae]
MQKAPPILRRRDPKKHEQLLPHIQPTMAARVPAKSAKRLRLRNHSSLSAVALKISVTPDGQKGEQ